MNKRLRQVSSGKYDTDSDDEHSAPKRIHHKPVLLKLVLGFCATFEIALNLIVICVI